MNNIPNYLSDLGVVIEYQHGISRVLYKEHNVMFAGIARDELREKLDASVDFALKHYMNNVKASGTQMEVRQVVEASFSVVVSMLCMYNKWRNFYEKHKNHPLAVTAEDLVHPQSLDQCWFYCQREFGAGYRTYAAALAGMTVEQFARYEEGRRRFFNR